jgi:hypothetical protein
MAARRDSRLRRVARNDINDADYCDRVRATIDELYHERRRGAELRRAARALIESAIAVSSTLVCRSPRVPRVRDDGSAEG